MKQQGVAGELVFDAGKGGPLAPDDPKFMNRQWRDHIDLHLRDVFDILLEKKPGPDASG